MKHAREKKKQKKRENEMSIFERMKVGGTAPGTSKLLDSTTNMDSNQKNGNQSDSETSDTDSNRIRKNINIPDGPHFHSNIEHKIEQLLNTKSTTPFPVKSHHNSIDLLSSIF